ncbi:MAG: acyloxyacyl hydrolase [Candidatus Thiodiazotropha sp. (ex Dulcina madagascariensis)]|nr:acyloxyacyl hydrolase [Candidatus Thiodiazotropha sp. (ex Dulcina madagascariensis)]
MTCKLSLLLLGTILPLSVLNATEEGEADKSPIRLGIEYLYPEDKSRDIKTANLNAFSLVRAYETIGLSLYAGLTASHASGDITQLEGDLNEGTLREVTYQNKAFGIGPGILADLRLWQGNKVSLHLDGSGSILFYNKTFPAGGDRYNFMWRGGPVVRYAIRNDLEIALGYRWMHLSNGQGAGSQNPSYDAQGVNLQYSILF